VHLRVIIICTTPTKNPLPAFLSDVASSKKTKLASDKDEDSDFNVFSMVDDDSIVSSSVGDSSIGVVGVILPPLPP
jgi:hypothetical protein